MARTAPVTSPTVAPALYAAGADPTATGTSVPVAPATEPTAEPAVLDDVLVEEVSIDGMCGVY